jgi:hypothetical protein
MHRADPNLLHAHPNTIVTLMWLLYSPRSQAHVVGAMPSPNPWLEPLPQTPHPSYFVVSSCSCFAHDSPFGHLVGPDFAKSLIAERVFCDFAYVFLDRSGKALTTPNTTEHFILSAPLLAGLASRADARSILVAGGEEKLDAIKTVLNAKLCNTLITDEDTARCLLE